jgi:hypothetical protein
VFVRWSSGSAPRKHVKAKDTKERQGPRSFAILVALGGLNVFRTFRIRRCGLGQNAI